MATDAKRRANAKYQKEKTKTLAIRFTPQDMELLEFIKSHDNIAQYIKGLVRADMEHR